MDYLGILFVLSILGAIIMLSYVSRKKQKSITENLPDVDPVQDQVVPMQFGGHTMYLSPADLVTWKTLTNAQRKQGLTDQVNSIRKGILVKVKNETGEVIGLITNGEAKMRGLI